MLRAANFHVAFCHEQSLDSEHGLIPMYPVSEDVLVWAYAEYDEDARMRASQQAERRRLAGKPPKANDQGGATAVRALHNGYLNIELICGLDIAASSKTVRNAALCGGGMPNKPRVRQMLKHSMRSKGPPRPRSSSSRSATT